MTAAVLSGAQQARIKRAVRCAVDANGGIDGAIAGAGRQRSTIGRWVARGEADLPPIDAAIGLDDIALSVSGTAPILTAMAQALGHVLVRPVAAPADDVTMHQWAATLARQSGDLFAHVALALAGDHVIDADEATQGRAHVHQLQTLLAGMDAALAEIERGDG